MKDRGVEKERGKRERARARELSQLFVLELVCLAGCRVLLCNHSIKAERERERGARLCGATPPPLDLLEIL